ncbi:PLP-dependent transferase [Spirochaetia bacterium 38H-sp]|uniref:PLP-dependent transferase n=1 Tax=Rarispira pelagica TaxID=3141764 RepID=A0ABU9UAC5_9SPIR
MRFLTRAVRSLRDADPAWGASVPPVYFSAGFEKEDPEELARLFAGKDAGFIYSRIGNPTVSAFERAFSSFVSARGAVAVSSGMAAITALVFALSSSGSKVALSRGLFSGTIALFRGVLRRAGIVPVFFDPLDFPSVEKALSEGVDFVFLEVISNPGMGVPHMDSIAVLSHEKGVPLVADCTLTPPGVFSPQKHGVDIAVHSLTKYISGNGTVVGGLIVDTGLFDWTKYKSEPIVSAASKAGEFALLYVLRKDVVQNMGFSISPMHAFLHYLGMETLPLRIKQHCHNALALAEFLAERDEIVSVRYPGLKSDPSYSHACNTLDGLFGGLFTFELKSKEECYAFVGALKLARNIVNIGDSSTLIIHPASTIYADASEEEKRGAGITEGLLRVSVGIEDSEDLIEDFENAFIKIYG